MPRWPTLSLLLLGVLVLTVASFTPAPGGEIPVWPDEIWEQLDEVETKVLSTQRKLAGARRRNDTRAVEKLQKEMNELQHERLKLLRVSQNLLPED